VPDVYLVPERLQAEGLDALVCERLGLERRRPTSASGAS
jgi:CTP synthase (UTP-ammonia lyase)